MPLRISPEDLSEQPSELNFFIRRNDRLVKNALRQLEYDGRIAPEGKLVGDHVEMQNEARRIKKSVGRRNSEAMGFESAGDEWKAEMRNEIKVEHAYVWNNDSNDVKAVAIKGESKEAGKSLEKKDDNSGSLTEPKKTLENKKNEADLNKKKSKNSKAIKCKTIKCTGPGSDLSVTRIDAVVFVVVLAQIVGCVSVGFEMYAHNIDKKWNRILNGKIPFDEVSDHHQFKGKTLNFAGHVYLTKALEYATREEAEELLFMILMITFLIASVVQIIVCYIKTRDVEQYTALLVGMYAVGGAICIYTSTLPVSAAVNIENSYTYAADMLYNFRLIDQDRPVTSRDRDMCMQGYRNGCDSYEYAKLQAFYLERIFRQCGSGSRFTRYYKSVTSATSIEVFGETYYRNELKDMGFCSRDGYKFAAAICALFMGMLCSIVPIIYCCESIAGLNKRGTVSADILQEFKAYVQRDSTDQDESPSEFETED